MRRKIDIQIKETELELQKLIRNEQGRLKLHRLSALYLYKTGQAKSYSAIGNILGYERHSISAWFYRYKVEGLRGLLKVEKPGPKERTKLSLLVMEGLRKKLSKAAGGFNSYREIQNWLHDSYAVDVSYSTVHSIVRYELEVNLKEVKRERMREASLA